MYLTECSLERFQSKYNVDATTGCWLWTGTMHKGKYPVFWVNGSRDVDARRLALSIVGRPVESGLHTRAKCGNTSCIAPDHAWIGNRGLDLGDGRKRCSRCRIPKPYSEFHFYRGPRTGQRLQSRCKDCQREDHRVDNQGNGKICRRKRTLKRYRIDPEVYGEMLQGQNGKCSICGGGNGDRDLAVDHCHNTGLVRSLLCGACNAGIAMFKHDPELMLKAIHYLKKHEIPSLPGVISAM